MIPIVLFQLLEENICAFVKTELRKIQMALSTDYFNDLEGHCEDEQVAGGKEAQQSRSSRAAFLEITVQFLRRMKQVELADSLKNSM